MLLRLLCLVGLGSDLIAEHVSQHRQSVLEGREGLLLAEYGCEVCLVVW